MFYKRLIINDMELTLAVNQTGAGAPTSATQGSVGMLYMDTLSGNFYKCVGDTGTFIWEPLITNSGGGGEVASNDFLVVRIDFNTNKASHSADEISAANAAGKIVVTADPDGMIVPLFYYDNTGAHFHAEYVDAESATSYIYVTEFVVDQNKNVSNASRNVSISGGSGGVDFETDDTLSLENGVLSVNTTSVMDQNSQLPITSAGLYAIVGDLEAILKTI